MASREPMRGMFGYEKVKGTGDTQVLNVMLTPGLQNDGGRFKVHYYVWETPTGCLYAGNLTVHCE